MENQEMINAMVAQALSAIIENSVLVAQQLGSGNPELMLKGLYNLGVLTNLLDRTGSLVTEAIGMEIGEEAMEAMIEELGRRASGLYGLN